MMVVPHVMRIKAKHMWIDYDEGADVIYISFEKPQKAEDSELKENNVLIRRRNGKIVGMTILNASTYKAH
ncbi:MAG: DUF2283 domain-containing protein [Candidatus Aenigmarchaeota archaeon]|nr:DUF2283 domain-containing protein [Candidatus Aenigmarchaeota archaeon]